MKILIDARMYGVEHTGIGRYTMNLLGELSRVDRKNDYTVILREKYFNELKLPVNFKKVLLDVQHYTVREQIILPYTLYRERPDIFHALQINVPIFYFGKMVTTIHDLTQVRKDSKATTLPLPLYLIKLLAIQIAFWKASHSDRLIVPTNCVKKELEAKGVSAEKIDVVYEGFDRKIASKSKSKKILKQYNITNPYFIYVGNAYPHKNIEGAIDALILFNKSRSNKAYLVIVSARNSFIKKLHDYIADNNAQDVINLVGYVSDEDLGVLLEESVAFVFPSLAEGFGLPGIEALAVGTLLLSSDIPVLREVYGGAASYFDPEDVKSLVGEMKSSLDLDKKSRKERIKKGQLFVKKYSWSKMAKETLSIYKQTHAI